MKLTNQLVSIIIPTYNRADLLPQTLDSIWDQTYENWECLIIDDGSVDNTKAVVASYVQKDPRFKYSIRPNGYGSGGNGARNYGFEISSGKFIQWFDSDDLMLPNYLQVKVEAMQASQKDFVITKTLNFHNEDKIAIKKYQRNLKNELNLLNFIKQKVYWLTPDFMVRRHVIEGVKFSETLKSNQETNFFLKFLCSDYLGIYIDETVTLRRLHDKSIRSSVEISTINSHKFRCLSLLDAYFYIAEQNKDATTLLALEKEILKSLYLSRFQIDNTLFKKFSSHIKAHRGQLQYFYLKLLKHLSKFNKGHRFYNELQNYR
ncbi:glycosyltransferase [Subsaxibacter sp. CAU 1640]|uniref:glycosyltransferase family 2 protein n=1 Tax=Subsaxibacter sp. CAU 1640 TaxID=2933271 RepID=UPI002002A3F2|nr:glycosyltransferase family 2 protein [Subsaxibacter sp. CAU 1640]MCK7589902.1 glycosyltransferase [Subsaxibacter sp. CAU 1640]